MKTASYFLNMDKESVDTVINDSDLGINDIEFIKTIKIDLIQSFYQSVETLFGFMHSLEAVESQFAIPDYLVSLQIRELHKFIKQFESYEFCYSYLKNGVIISDINISKLQFLFYFITVLIENLPEESNQKIIADSNIVGTARLLNELAKEFNQEVHNSIKHGLRCILMKKFKINLNIPPEMEGIDIPQSLLDFNGHDDLLLYYAKDKGQNNATTVVVPIDIEKMIVLSDGLNKLLHNMLHQRSVIFSKEPPGEVSWHLLDKDEQFYTFPKKSNFKSIRFGTPT